MIFDSQVTIITAHDMQCCWVQCKIYEIMSVRTGSSVISFLWPAKCTQPAAAASAAAEVVGNSLANFVLNDLRLDDPNLTTIPSQPTS